MLGIVFTGASGVGKSTLAKWAATKYRLPLLPSVTTDVYTEFNTTFDAAFADADLLARIQSEIHLRTANRLYETAVAQGEGFVTDRGPDVLIYTALMCHGYYERPPVDYISRATSRPDVLTVFVRPCPTILAKARATDGGRRNLFLSDEWVYRVDGALAFYLETMSVPHITLEGADHRGRRATLERIISAMQWKGWPEDHERVKVGATKKLGGKKPKGETIDMKAFMRP